MKFGPPPPGYVRIIGEPVPGWQPEDMTAARRMSGINPMRWLPIGPKPILDEFWSGTDDASGRVVSLAVHPDDPNTVYAASASGGMWKTTDGGATWEPKTDELSILNHGCVALDPSNPDVVYLGTGEYTTLSSGDGLFRSLDGGTTFTRIGTTSEVGSQCSKVFVDPTNPDIIHLTGRGGYVRSVDGGTSWEVRLSGSCSDVALNPDDPSIVYVARHGAGVFKSTDGGASFAPLTNGLPSSDVNRILLSIAISNPDVLYAVIINGASGLRGLYKTTNAGASWSRLDNTPNFPTPQGWYDCFVGVDPTDENVVYCGGVFPTFAEAGVIKSTDGGSTWVDISFGSNGVQVHPDQQTVAFGPTGELWIGNDGGIWSSLNGGQGWINHNNRLTITQNYTIAVHPTDPNRVMGGTQDNGTVARDIETDQWPQIVAGDGGFLAYDFDSPTRRYTTFVRLTVFRLDSTGATRDITGPWGSDSVNFIAPLVMDPGNSRTLLGGTNRIWRTTNAADAAVEWTDISTSVVSGGGNINAIAVGPDTNGSPSNNIYSGSTNGRVYFTDDALTWSNRSAGLPGSGVSDIMVNPADAAEAYVSFFRNTGGRVYKTNDSGLNWTDMTGSLTNGVTANALAVYWDVDPPAMYVGSGAGVYASLDDGNTWTKDGPDLPNVNIGDLFIDPIRAEITAGTFGRGAWRSTLAPCTTNTDCDDGDLCNGTETCNVGNSQCVVAFTDCNRNGINDACDMGACGGDPACSDCNANGVPDHCDLFGLFVVASPELSPVVSGQVLNFELEFPPKPVGDVTFSFAVSADLGESTQGIDVQVNGVLIGSVFGSDGRECPLTPDSAELILSLEEFNAIPSFGLYAISLITFGNVGAGLCPSSFIEVAVQYETLTGLDCNKNNIPDDCEPDCQPNGIPDECEFADGSVEDCQPNGIPDACDIASGTSADANGTGIPDECEPCIDNAECNENGVCEFGRCLDGVCQITPALYGDVASAGGICGPDGGIDLADILAVLDGFSGTFRDGCELVNVDIAGVGGNCTPDEDINLSDILNVLDAFQGLDRCCAGLR